MTFCSLVMRDSEQSFPILILHTIHNFIGFCHIHHYMVSFPKWSILIYFLSLNMEADTYISVPSLGYLLCSDGLT